MSREGDAKKRVYNKIAITKGISVLCVYRAMESGVCVLRTYGRTVENITIGNSVLCLVQYI